MYFPGINSSRSSSSPSRSLERGPWEIKKDKFINDLRISGESISSLWDRIDTYDFSNAEEKQKLLLFLAKFGTPSSKDLTQLLLSNLSPLNPLFDDEGFRFSLASTLTSKDSVAAEKIALNIEKLSLTDPVLSENLADSILDQGEWAVQALAKKLHTLPLSPATTLRMAQMIARVGSAPAKSLAENLHLFNFISCAYEDLPVLLNQISSYGSYAAAALIPQIPTLPISKEVSFSLIVEIAKHQDEAIMNELNKHLLSIPSFQEDALAVKMLPPSIQVKAMQNYVLSLKNKKTSTGENTIFWEHLSNKFPLKEHFFLKCFIFDFFENREAAAENVISQLESFSFESPEKQLNMFRTFDHLSELADKNTISHLLEKLSLSPFQDQNTWQRNLVALTTALSLGEEANALVLESSLLEKVEDSLQTNLATYFPCIQSRDDLNNYLLQFGLSRQPFVLLSYFKGYQTLPETEKSQAVEGLQLFVKEVLGGNYLEKLFADSDNMDSIFRDREDLKQKWVNGAELPYSTFMSSEEAERIDIKKFITERISYNHISFKQLPRLAEALYGVNAEALASLPDSTSTHSPDELKSIENLLFSLILEDKKSDLEKAQEIYEYVNHSTESSQFQRDLCTLMNYLQGSTLQNPSDLSLVITHDPFDMLYTNTDTQGSCLNAAGHSECTKCVLDFLLDGKNQLVAVKDSSGTVQGWSTLRILWDQVDNRPALFLEPFYTNDRSLIPAIKKMAINFSQQLGLPLLAHCDGDRAAACHLVSFSSRSPFVYADSSTDDQYINNGHFNIRRAQTLYEGPGE